MLSWAMLENSPPMPAAFGGRPPAGLPPCVPLSRAEGLGDKDEGGEYGGVETLAEEDARSLGVGPKDWTNPVFLLSWKAMLSFAMLERRAVMPAPAPFGADEGGEEAYRAGAGLARFEMILFISGLVELPKGTEDPDDILSGNFFLRKSLLSLFAIPSFAMFENNAPYPPEDFDEDWEDEFEVWTGLTAGDDAFLASV